MKFSKLSVLATLTTLGVTAFTGCASEEENVTEDELRAEASDLVITNANLVDPASRTVKRGALLIKDGKIKKVVTADRVRIEGQPQTLDAQKGYLIPGLSDLHTHLFFGNSSPHGFSDEASQDFASQEQLGKRYLYAGVTSYLDLFAPSDAGDDPAQTLGADLNIFAVRAKSREQNDFVHPNSYVAGPLFVVPGSHGVLGFAAGDVVRIDVRDAAGLPLSASALAAVADTVGKRVEKLINDKHPDVIKFIYDNHTDQPVSRPESMPLTIAKAIIDAATRKRTKTVAHVGTWKGVEDLANAGVSAFTHLPSGEAPASTIAALKRANTTAITTMSIYNDYGDMADDAKRSKYFDFRTHRLLRDLIPPGLASAYENFNKYTDEDKGWVAWGAKHNRLNSQGLALKSLIKGKVRVLPGTDSGNTGAFYGYSLSRELINFAGAQADMSSWDILSAATFQAQEFLGEDKSGKLAVGHKADLVILSENPVESIANVQKVKAVVLHGRVLNRETLLQ